MPSETHSVSSPASEQSERGKGTQAPNQNRSNRNPAPTRPHGCFRAASARQTQPAIKASPPIGVTNPSALLPVTASK